jgi:RNA recognition motif-containing protein
MEYCDLKRDRGSARSKGYAYVNFSTPEVAALAIEQLHGTEFPPHSGYRIKVRRALHPPLPVSAGLCRSPRICACGAGASAAPAARRPCAS